MSRQNSPPRIDFNAIAPRHAIENVRRNRPDQLGNIMAINNPHSGFFRTDTRVRYIEKILIFFWLCVVLILVLTLLLLNEIRYILHKIGVLAFFCNCKDKFVRIFFPGRLV